MEAALHWQDFFLEDRNNYDYVYLARDLIELREKCFDKRNHINKF